MPILVVMDQTWYCSKTVSYSLQRGFDVAAFPPSSLHSAAHHLMWDHTCTWLPPLMGAMWLRPLFVSLTTLCVTTAAMSWGEGGLITDCSLFLPAPLGETHTVNWMRTRREPNCGWGWPLLHENNILYQKAFLNFLFPLNAVVSQQAYLKQYLINLSKFVRSSIRKSRNTITGKWKDYCTIHHLIIYLSF